MFSSSLSRLTRQLTQLSVAAAPKLTNTTINTTPQLLWKLPSRSFAINRKVIDAKNAKRLKIQAKKKKSIAKPASDSVEDGEATKAASPEQPFLQHQEWVKFQQSITVDGFQTGQVTEALVLKKSRGGKQARSRREKELARLQQQQDAGSQKFPAIRYSPEETEELLKLAFNTLPERTGKRGTRSLKREARRWKLVREIRSKYKKHIVEAHHRRMEKRNWKREQVKAVKAEALGICDQQLDYQGQLLKRWAATMFEDAGTNEQEAGEKLGSKE